MQRLWTPRYNSCKCLDHFSFLAHASSWIAFPPITEPCSDAIAVAASSAVLNTTQLSALLLLPNGATHLTLPAVFISSLRSFHVALSVGRFPTQTFFSASYLLMLGPLPLPLPLPFPQPPPPPSNCFKTQAVLPPP